MMKIKHSITALVVSILICCNSTNNLDSGIKESPNTLSTPNFIFYLADDQDQLDYGCYGNPKIETFNVDKLANEGMRFTNFHTAQAICAPSRSQLYTGMYPMKNGCMANHISVKPNIKSITYYLEAAGYDVVLAGKSHVKPDNVFKWSKAFEAINHRYLPFDKIDDFFKNANKPFCIFITSDFPHGPYGTGETYSIDDVYKLPYENNIPSYKPGFYENVADDNEQLGKILDMVDTFGLKNDAIFIYASDHGLSGKWTVKEKGLKVPFIVRWPGVVPAKSVSNTMLGFIDVMPTFLDIANAPIPKDIDGKSFKSVLTNPNATINEYMYGIATNQNILKCKVFPSRMVKDAQYKYIKNYNSVEVYKSNYGNNSFVNRFIEIGAKSFPNTPYEELYDLLADPYEKNNLAKNANYQTIKERLSEALNQWMLAQNDFSLTYKMPLIKPLQNPLDKPSQWNIVPDDLVNTLDDSVYIKLHY